MAVFTNQRIHQIFTNIQSEIVSQDELAKRFGVSTRTIRSDINELNEYLQDMMRVSFMSAVMAII